MNDSLALICTKNVNTRLTVDHAIAVLYVFNSSLEIILFTLPLIYNIVLYLWIFPPMLCLYIKDHVEGYISVPFSKILGTTFQVSFKTRLFVGNACIRSLIRMSSSYSVNISNPITLHLQNIFTLSFISITVNISW